MAITERGINMIESNLTVWMVSMFLLGLVSMGACILFLKACEKI